MKPGRYAMKVRTARASNGWVRFPRSVSHGSDSHTENTIQASPKNRLATKIAFRRRARLTQYGRPRRRPKYRRSTMGAARGEAVVAVNVTSAISLDCRRSMVTNALGVSDKGFLRKLSEKASRSGVQSHVFRWFEQSNRFRVARRRVRHQGSLGAHGRLTSDA